jgi:transposase-like protein
MTQPAKEPLCVRCHEELAPVDSASFFRCPSCKREFTRAVSGSLIYRWGHPISLLLYPVIYEDRPEERAADVAAAFARQHDPEGIRQAIDEIRLELGDPTQPVREIVGARASEAELRDFLCAVAKYLARAPLPQGE